MSVILPVYNGEGHVEHMLSDLLGQRGVQLEIIVVDDGSTDATGSVLARFSSAPEVNIIRFEKNVGVSSARNAGIARARGEFIFFVDADDRLSDPDGLCKLVGEARFECLDVVWVPLRQRAWGQNLNAGAVISRRHENWSNLIARSILYEVINSPIKLYRTGIVRRSDSRFDEDLAIGEDLVFNLNVLVHTSRIKYSRHPVYRIVGRADSATRAPAPDLPEQLQKALNHAKGAAPDVDAAIWSIIGYKNRLSVRRRQLRSPWGSSVRGELTPHTLHATGCSSVRPTTRFGARWTVVTTVFALLSPNQLAKLLNLVDRLRKPRHSGGKAVTGTGNIRRTALGDGRVPPQ